VGALLAVSGDGKSIVGVRAGKAICIWDAATGELRHKRELPGEAWSTRRLSPDGRWLVRSVLGPEEQLEVWDVLTGTKVRELAIKGARYIMPAAFSSDGKRVAAVGHRRAGGAPGRANEDDHLVRAWDVVTGKQLFAVDVRNNVSSSQLASGVRLGHAPDPVSRRPDAAAGQRQGREGLGPEAGQGTADAVGSGRGSGPHAGR
jgi:WD40 repeat protein